jgi:hypothetical protein
LNPSRKSVAPIFRNTRVVRFSANTQPSPSLAATHSATAHRSPGPPPAELRLAARSRLQRWPPATWPCWPPAALPQMAPRAPCPHLAAVAASTSASRAPVRGAGNTLSEKDHCRRTDPAAAASRQHCVAESSDLGCSIYAPSSRFSGVSCTRLLPLGQSAGHPVFRGTLTLIQRTRFTEGSPARLKLDDGTWNITIGSTGARELAQVSQGFVDPFLCEPTFSSIDGRWQTALELNTHRSAISYSDAQTQRSRRSGRCVEANASSAGSVRRGAARPGTRGSSDPSVRASLERALPGGVSEVPLEYPREVRMAAESTVMCDVGDAIAR